jgi:peptidoglycan/LPS O-acetylase OafA/YrhL
MDAMAMGALLSFWFVQANPSSREIKRKAACVLAAGLAGEMVLHFQGLTHIMSKSLVALMFVALLALSLAWNPLCKILSTAPLRLTGKVSYCLYLAHPVVGDLVYHEFHGASLAMKATRSLLILALSYAVAFLSWNCFETPILNLKKYFGSRGLSKDQALSIKSTPASFAPAVRID